MNYREIRPLPGLESVVRCFWFLRGEVSSPVPEPVVPDGRLEIILHLADPFWTVSGSVDRQPETLIAGQLTRPFLIRSGRVVDVVGIRFRTAATRALVESPLPEFTDGVTDLESVDRPLARALYEAAAACVDPEARVYALSSVLNRRVRRERLERTTSMVRSLVHRPGESVSDLARRHGMSRRTFERRVLEDTGLSPHLLRRVLRFRAVFPRLDRTPAGQWSTLAHRAGYYDQSHLIRDFRRFAGAPPSSFFAEGSDLSRQILTDSGTEYDR